VLGETDDAAFELVALPDFPLLLPVPLLLLPVLPLLLLPPPELLLLSLSLSLLLLFLLLLLLLLLLPLLLLPLELELPPDLPPPPPELPPEPLARGWMSGTIAARRDTRAPSWSCDVGGWAAGAASGRGTGAGLARTKVVKRRGVSAVSFILGCRWVGLELNVVARYVYGFSLTPKKGCEIMIDV
jgi:hypothetical protein